MGGRHLGGMGLWDLGLGSKKADLSMRWQFDLLHINHSTGYTIALVCPLSSALLSEVCGNAGLDPQIDLISGAAPQRSLVRLCALPPPSSLLFFGVVFLAFRVYCHLGLDTLFRISPLPLGVPMRALGNTVLKDVIGGNEAREEIPRAAQQARRS